MWSKSTFIRIGTVVATALVLGGIAPRPALAGDGDPSCGFTVDGQPGESLDVEIDPAFLEGFPSDLTPDGFGLLVEYFVESSDLFDPLLIDVVFESSGTGGIWTRLSATSNAGDEVEGGLDSMFPSGQPSFGYLFFPLFVGLDIAVFGDPSSYPLEVTFSAGDVADDLPDNAAGALCSFTFTFDVPGQSRRNPIDLDHYLDRAEAGALPNTL